MIETIAVILLILWVLALVSAYTRVGLFKINGVKLTPFLTPSHF